MTSEALEARRTYNCEYRKRNRERINQRRREWRARSRELVKAAEERYWEKKAGINKGGGKYRSGREIH